MALNENSFYDMTKQFLTGAGKEQKRLVERPEDVKRVLTELRDVAPETVRILERYIKMLEVEEDR